MQRRSFRAMGTDVELLLDADRDRAPRRHSTAAEQEVHRLEQLLSRFQPDSELSRLNRCRQARRRAAPTSCGWSSSHSRRARRPAASSIRPSTTRSSRPATTARSKRSARDATGRGPSAVPAAEGHGERLDDRARAGLAARPRRHRQGLRRRPRLRAARHRRAMPRQRRRRHRRRRRRLADRGHATTSRSSSPAAGSPPPDATAARWRRGGEEQHHLIDPSTGGPAALDSAGHRRRRECAADAEVLAKVAFLGADVDAPHVLVGDDGRAVLAGGLA